MKVKAAGGRIARSTMSLVASSLDCIDFYREKLFRYLREMPVVKEWSGKIRSYEASLQSFEVKLENVKELAAITKDMHFILEALRSKLSEPLQELVKSRASMLAGKCIAGEVLEEGAAVAGIAQQILQELSILWPLDTELQSLTLELAGHMQSINLASQQQMVASLMEEVGVLLTEEEVSVDSVMAAVSKVQAACASITVTEGTRRRAPMRCAELGCISWSLLHAASFKIRLLWMRSRQLRCWMPAKR